MTYQKGRIIFKSRHRPPTSGFPVLFAAAGAFATIKSCQIASQQNKQQKLIEQQDQSILTLKNKLTEKDVTLSVQKKTIDSLLKTKDGAKQKDTNIVTLTK